MGLDIYFHSSNYNEEVGYFRKVNSLLKWIEDNVAEFDNCERILIEKRHLEQLKATLDQLTPENCSELFPTQGGFFYGSTDYDEYYWQDVEEVKLWVEETLENFDFEAEKLIFHAWW